jgi:hypothetical protein
LVVDDLKTRKKCIGRKAMELDEQSKREANEKGRKEKKKTDREREMLRTCAVGYSRLRTESVSIKRARGLLREVRELLWWMGSLVYSRIWYCRTATLKIKRGATRSLSKKAYKKVRVGNGRSFVRRGVRTHQGL